MDRHLPHDTARNARFFIGAVNAAKMGILTAGQQLVAGQRGDPGTVERHLEALRNAGLESEVELYRKLGLAALDLALEAGLEPEKAGQMKKALTA